MIVKVTESSLSVGTNENPNMDALGLWHNMDQGFMLPEHAYGETGYIDGLKPEDLPRSVVSGKDNNKRPFISLRVEFEFNGKLKIGVVTYFQRYSDNTDIWCNGGRPRMMRATMRVSDFNDLVEIIDNGEVTIECKKWGGAPEYLHFKLV